MAVKCEKNSLNIYLIIIFHKKSFLKLFKTNVGNAMKMNEKCHLTWKWFYLAFT